MMSELKILNSTETRAYLGPELRPHFILSHYGLEGSALIAFQGPCQVKTEHLVDWEDRLAKDHISAKQMVHFLGEFFGITLREGVWIQRCLVQICGDLLREKLGTKIEREGDDLYSVVGRERFKLSVSIVTASPVSVLLHLGINVDATGAPVQAKGLSDIGIENPMDFIDGVLGAFQREWASVGWACVKVRPVV